MNRGEIIDLFDGCEYPEHVEKQLRSILEAVSAGADLSEEEWQEALETLARDVEFGEADWLK